MAEEDNEVLDWGNEDDLVSLGDEEERYALEDPSQNGATGASAPVDAASTPPRPISPADTNSEASTPVLDQQPHIPDPATATTNETSKPIPPVKTPHRLTILPRITHALPPKPMVTNVPYLPPSHPSIVEATAMATTRLKKASNTGHGSKTGSSQDDVEPLPPHWEIRHPRSGTGVYYYNTQTFQSQWTRPVSRLSPGLPRAPRNPALSPRTNRAPSDPDPAKSTPTKGGSPPPLSHDDRHYRPGDDNRYSGSGRRHEPPADETEARHGRSHHSNNSARSPQRGRERSRSPTPPPAPTRDSRAHSYQRPARGRTGTKTNSTQGEFDGADLPNDQERHWTPAQLAATPSNNKLRNPRRQQRSQHYPADDQIQEPEPEEVSHVPPLRENNVRGFTRDKDRTYPPSEYPSHTISAPRPVSPQDGRTAIETHFERSTDDQQREPFEDRHRSPGAMEDHIPSQSTRRERASRFDRSAPSSSSVERNNGLPMKPTHDDRTGDFRRGGTDQPYDRLPDQGRRYEAPAPQDPYLTYPQSTTAEHPRDSDRLWVPGPNVDRNKASPHSEVSSSSGSRKRAPLPPQEAEYRGLAKPKPAVYPETTTLRPRDVPRSPPPYHGRDKVDKSVNVPPAARSYPTRDEGRDRGYGQMTFLPRTAIAADYEREHERDKDRDRGRSRAHNEQNDADRSYDIPMDQPLPNESRGYQDRDLPSKPRAMQPSVSTSSSAYTPSGSSTSGPPPATRYQDRPSPPHLSMTGARREQDPRSAALHVWPERQERPFIPAERPRGRGAPTSNANSIPIGTRRPIPGNEPNINEYSANPPTDRYDRSPFGTSDLPPRPARSYEEIPKSYPDPDPMLDGRTNYARPPRGDDQYPKPDEREYGRRGDKVENSLQGQTPLQTPLPPSQADNPTRQRLSRFSSSSRNQPRFEHESPPELRPSKTWSNNDYDTRGRYPTNDPPHRDPTPPPLSRETSYTSPHWEPAQPPYEPAPRVSDYHDPVGYRNLPPQDALMDADARQSVQHNGSPDEHYRRKEGDFVGAGRPAPRGVNRRDHSTYSPDVRRAPVVDLPLDGAERGSGIRPKWDQTSAPFNDNQRSERPRMLNERISALPEDLAHKQPHVIYQDSGFNGELDAFEPRVSERNNPRQDDFTNHPVKSFEQRINLPDRPPPMARGASLLSRISRGGNDVRPASDAPPQSLRDRVQIPAKRDRDDLVRDHHFMDTSFEADDSELDPTGVRKSRKRRRPRRGGPS